MDAPSIHRTMSTVTSMPRPVVLRQPSHASDGPVDRRERCVSVVYSRDSDSKTPFRPHSMLEDDMNFFEAVSALPPLPPAPGTRAARLSKDRQLVHDPFSRQLTEPATMSASPQHMHSHNGYSSTSASMLNHRSAFADAFASSGMDAFDNLPGSQSEF